MKEDIYKMSTDKLIWNSQYERLRQLIELSILPQAERAIGAVESLNTLWKKLKSENVVVAGKRNWIWNRSDVQNLTRKMHAEMEMVNR
jgi:hypothetical protein